MLKKMIASEIKLNVNVAICCIIVAAFTTMALIWNNELFFMIGFYAPLGYLANAYNFNSMQFYNSLPIKRSKKYAAAVLVSLILELLTFAVFSAAGAIRRLIVEYVTAAESVTVFKINLTTLGSLCVGFGFFNIVMLPLFATEKLNSMLFALPCIAFVTGYFGMQIPTEFLYLNDMTILADYSNEWLWLRITVFAAGISLFILLTGIGYAIGKKIFEKRNI